jgi:phage shock protein C
MAKSKTKRLYRSEKNRMIAGVAGGLGEYFDIDPVIVRLIFVLVAIYGGSGVLIYVILWLVIPSQSDTKSSTEKNVEKGAKEIQDKAEDMAKSIKKNGNNKIFLGIFMIVIGLMLFLGNFGFVHIFNMWKLWPLVIIAIGISLLA